MSRAFLSGLSRLKRPTVRVKVTAACAALTVTAGAGLIALISWLLWSSLPIGVPELPADAFQPPPGTAPPALGHGDPTAPATEVGEIIRAAQDAALHRMLLLALLGLALLAVAAVAVSWWLAGRILRPVHRLTTTARRLTAEDLHERIALDGPQDELKELADTFDAMLDRVENAVAAQRRFVANAAHELRTPLAVQRVGLEVGLLDPDPQQVAEIRSVLLDATDRTERLLAGLLLLSTSEQGLDHSEPVELHTVVQDALADSADEASAAQVDVDARLDAVTVDGDGVLLDRLVRNLVSNAIRYNTRPGHIEIRLRRDSGEDGTEQAVLEVGNTGPTVPADVVPHLFEPFRRLRPRQHAPGEGNGLGLSIAASITAAHQGTITAEPRLRGGLTVRVVLPLLPLLSSAGEYRLSAADADATPCKDRDRIRRP